MHCTGVPSKYGGFGPALAGMTTWSTDTYRARTASQTWLTWPPSFVVA